MEEGRHLLPDLPAQVKVGLILDHQEKVGVIAEDCDAQTLNHEYEDKPRS